jgi:SAM-dependent methyltransferase
MPTLLSDTAASDKPDNYFTQARTEIEPLLPARAAKALEIGCGAGVTMHWLRDRIPVDYAVGVEMDPASAVRAASSFDLVLTGDAEKLDLPDDKFDLIIVLDVLEHLQNPWSMVQRLHRVLAPAGVIIASIPNIGHHSIAWGLLKGRWNYEPYGLLDRTHLRFFTKTTAIELMSQPGLRVNKVNVMRAPGLAWASQRVRWYAFKLIGLLVPDHLLAFQFLIRSARVS